MDDDAAKIGRHINGVPVIAPNEVSETVERLGVSDILLALPSASRQRRHQIIEGLRSLPVHIRTLPGMADLATGRVSISDFLELDLEDLLGRDSVPPNSALLARDLAGKAVLVTGAGGSIGSELCRQILAEHPSKMLLVEHNEFGLYSIHQELEQIVERYVAWAPRHGTRYRCLAASATSGACQTFVERISRTPFTTRRRTSMYRWSSTTRAKGWPTMFWVR